MFAAGDRVWVGARAGTHIIDTASLQVTTRPFFTNSVAFRPDRATVVITARSSLVFRSFRKGKTHAAVATLDGDIELY